MFDPWLVLSNQGLDNGFLAAGLVWGLIAGEPTGPRVQVLFGCVAVRSARRRRLVLTDDR
jgi:putative membrane protein